MPQRSRSSCEDWLAASIPSAFSLFLGHSAIAETNTTFDRLTTSGGKTTLGVHALPLDSGTSISVEAGVQTLLEGSVGYSTANGTCTFLGSGSYSAASPPSHGMLSYGILDHTVQSGDVCNGHTFSYAVVYYTWTDTQSGATQDSFAVQWSGPDGLSGGPYDYTAELNQTAAGIAFNGQNIASTTQTVTIGQQISLTASPNTGHWITPVDGSPISGFTPGASCTEETCFPPANFSSQNVTFYWSTPSDGAVGAAQPRAKSQVYDLQWKYDDENGNPITLTAHFQVVGPGLSIGGLSGGQTYLLRNLANGGHLVDKQPPPAAAIGCGAVGNPDGKPSSERICAYYKVQGNLQGGNVEFIQVLNKYNSEFTTKLGYYPHDLSPGRDGPLPYPSLPDGVSTNDQPSISLLDDCALSIDVDFSASMYVLWTPGTPGSVFVPLGHFDWGWMTHAVRQSVTDIWTVTNNNVTGTTDFHSDNSYPIYSSAVVNTPPLCPKGSK